MSQKDEKGFVLALRKLKNESALNRCGRLLSPYRTEVVVQKREMKAHKDKNTDAPDGRKSQAGFLNCKCLKDRTTFHSLLIFTN